MKANTKLKELNKRIDNLGYELRHLLHKGDTYSQRYKVLKILSDELKEEYYEIQVQMGIV